MKLFLTFLFAGIIGQAVCQNAENNHEYKNLAFSANGGFGSMSSFGVGTGGYAVHYRFDNIRHALGLVINGDITWNEQNRIVTGANTNGDIVTYKADLNFGMMSFLANYRYYLINPTARKFSLNIGASLGFSNQTQIVDPTYTSLEPQYDENGQIDINSTLNSFTNKPETVFIEGKGLTANGHLGAEYATKYIIFFTEASIGYSTINSKIDFFNSQGVVTTSFRLGLAIDLLRKK